MNPPSTAVELLSPAKNYEFGTAAIDHGADAVYIGAPAYGARQAATNTIEDIHRLVDYAHLFACKVYATVNTILFDDEIEQAVAMIHRLHQVGVDAIILQDLGLLDCDLPPIALHASTQCHNATPERVRLMQQLGMQRAILARETSLRQMAEIRQSTTIELEAFVHGALCVSYSGQCYMSQYLTSRSGNRGCCSQPCRNSYDLATADGRTIMSGKHLLSLKDFDASSHLQAMVDAGITSFKIEGRLKDLAYVKNITAHYRNLIDSLAPRCKATSSGLCDIHFKPDPERTFNRGYTDYFLVGRKPMASFLTQKSIGKRVATVRRVERNSIVVDSLDTIVAGDGLCFMDASQRMSGFYINRIEGNRLFPNTMPNIKPDIDLWRNHDHAFSKMLDGKTAERKLNVDFTFDATPDSITIEMRDCDGICTLLTQSSLSLQAANDAAAVSEQILRQLRKLGNTPFSAASATDLSHGQFFVPTSVVNDLRRRLVEQHIAKRISVFRPIDVPRTPSADISIPDHLDYRANVVNHHSEALLHRLGATSIEHGLEQTLDYDGKALMTTKYCLRYELGCCTKKGGQSVRLGIKASDTLLLKNGNRTFRLIFDCANCQMTIVKH